MARVCYLCGKKTEFGGNRKHRRGSSGGGGAWSYRSQRTSRTWRPNLRPAKLVDDQGKEIRERVCMKCYKKLRKEEELSVVKSKGISTRSHKKQEK